MGFKPSSGQELQSEYLVPRRHAEATIRALRMLAGAIQPVLLVSEIRTVAADRLWMSPQYGQDTIGVHFTWKPDQDAVERVLAEVEAALARFGARPHWGKVFLADAAVITGLYEHLPDFIRLMERLDPRGAFRNAWLNTRLLAAPR
jgi:xylitol oxidase